MQRDNRPNSSFEKLPSLVQSARGIGDGRDSLSKGHRICSKACGGTCPNETQSSLRSQQIAGLLLSPTARLNFAMSVNDPTRNLRYPPKGTNLLNPNSARTKKHQRFGLRSGNGIPAWVLAISAARAAASSLGGGGPDSLLASTLRIGTGIISALTGCGSKPPAASTVLHSCGSFAIVGDLRGLLGPADGCMVPAIAALFSLANQLVSSSPQPSSLLKAF